MATPGLLATFGGTTDVACQWEDYALRFNDGMMKIFNCTLMCQ
jgi:hypothetical protein